MTAIDECGVKCRICGSENMGEDRCLSDSFFSNVEGKNYFFSICNDCKTIQCQNGGILDYEVGSTFYNKEEYINYDLACDAGLYFFSYLLLIAESISKKRGGKRILEVGGGLGITSHIAKLCFGWREMNVDPNIRADLGRRIFGIDSFRGYTNDLSAEHGGKFDVLVCSEVIEHVPEPDAFLQSLRPLLAEDGIIVLTTPNSEDVAFSCNKDADFVDVVESYGVGQHYNIYSALSLQLLLERNGFGGVTIVTSEGTTDNKRLIAVAKEHGGVPVFSSGNENRKNINRLFKEYVVKAKNESTKNKFHERYKNGLDFRLFETYVNEGNFAEAQKISEEINAYLAISNSDVAAAENPSAGDFIEMMHKYTPYVGKYYFYYGLLLMNYQIDYPLALRCFSAAYSFSCMQDSLLGCSHIIRYAGLAAIHKARILDFLEKHEEGISFLGNSLKLERIPKDIRLRLTAEIEDLRLHMKKAD